MISNCIQHPSIECGLHRSDYDLTHPCPDHPPLDAADLIKRRELFAYRVTGAF
jgi:hypothetical protein